MAALSSPLSITQKRYFHLSTAAKHESSTEELSEEQKKHASILANNRQLIAEKRYQDSLNLLKESFPDINTMPPKFVMLTAVAALGINDGQIAHEYFYKAMQEFPHQVDTSFLIAMILQIYSIQVPVLYSWAYSRVIDRLHLLIEAEGIPAPTDTTSLLEAAERVQQNKSVVSRLLTIYAYQYHAIGDYETPVEVLRVAIMLDQSNRDPHLELLGRELNLARTNRLKPTDFLASSAFALKSHAYDTAVVQFFLTAMWMSLNMDAIFKIVDGLSKLDVSPRTFVPWVVNSHIAKGDKEAAQKIMDECDYKTSHHGVTQERRQEETVLSVLERARTYIMLNDHATVKSIIMDLVEKRDNMTQMERDLVIDFISAELQQAPQLAIWTLHRYLKYQPYDATYLTKLAEFELSINRPEMAINLMRSLEKIERLSINNITLLVRIYSQWKEYDKALYLTRLSQTFNPAGEQVFDALAKKDFSIDLSNRQPTHAPYAHSMESALLLQLGRYDEAIETFERRTEETGVFCPMGSAYLGLFFAGAINRVLEPIPSNFDSYLDEERAFKLLLKSGEISNGAPPAVMAIVHELLTKMLIKRGRSREAEIHTRKSAEYTEQVIQSGQH